MLLNDTNVKHRETANLFENFGKEAACCQHWRTTETIRKKIRWGNHRRKKKKFNHPGQTTIRATLSSRRTSLRRSIEGQQTAPIIFHRSRGDRVFEM